MALSLNKPKRDNLTNEIWKSAERLRGKFKSYEYQSVITAAINAQIVTLTAYRTSLIHECVTGQRRVTDADVLAAV